MKTFFALVDNNHIKMCGFCFQQEDDRNLHLDTANKAAKPEGRVDTEDDSLGNSGEDSYDEKLRRTTSEIIASIKKRVAMQKSPPLQCSEDGVGEETSTAHPVPSGKSTASVLDSAFDSNSSIYSFSSIDSGLPSLTSSASRWSKESDDNNSQGLEQQARRKFKDAASNLLLRPSQNCRRLHGITSHEDPYNWDLHIDSLLSRAGSLLYILRVCKYYRYTKDQFGKLFDSLIMLLFLYGLEVWGSAYQGKYLDRIDTFFLPLYHYHYTIRTINALHALLCRLQLSSSFSRVVPQKPTVTILFIKNINRYFFCFSNFVIVRASCLPIRSVIILDRD